MSLSHEDEFFYLTLPSTVPLNLGNSYEFCLIFTEDNFNFYVGCSNNFLLIPHHITTVDLNNSRILQSSIKESDISSFDVIADKQNDPLYMNDDMMRSSYSTAKTIRKTDPIIEHDDSIEVYPSSQEYYNTLWPNLSLSFLIIIMSISIVYILWSKYRFYYKHSSNDSISPSYSDDSINTQIEDENDNAINKYVKLEATTTL